MNAPHRMLSSPERLRLTVENFLLLNDSRAFADYTKAELIDGTIYVMNAQHHPHSRAKTRWRSHWITSCARSAATLRL